MLTDALAIIEAGIEYPEEDIEADIKAGRAAACRGGQGSKRRKLAGTFGSGRMLRDGYAVVIAGRPNVGKSSLFQHAFGQRQGDSDAHTRHHEGRGR